MTHCSYCPIEGHPGVFAAEIHPPEVQQHVCVSLVGLLFGLVPGYVLALDDPTQHGL